MHIELQSGRAYYSTAGAGDSGPGVLFIHGAGMDHTVWTLPARFFARHGLRVVSPDLPAHGRSSGPALTSIEAMAGWYADLAQALGLERLSVVGHSMGSLIALELAAAQPDLVERVALFGTASPMAVSDPLLNAARDEPPAAYRMANTWSHSTDGLRGGNANPGLWMMGQGQRLLERMPNGAYHADLSACNDYANAAETAARVQCPAIVVAGTGDLMTRPKLGAVIADALPEARQITLPGCGHDMMNEQPNAVLDALADFIPREN